MPKGGSVYRDVLECLHMCGNRSDAFGPTNASRRRCARCRDGKPAEVQIGADGGYEQLPHPGT